MAESYLGNLVLSFTQRSLPEFCLVRELQEAPATLNKKVTNYTLPPVA